MKQDLKLKKKGKKENKEVARQKMKPQHIILSIQAEILTFNF